MTDTSGIVKQLHVLTNTHNQTRYFQELETKFANLLNQNLEKYDRFTIHTPFNFKQTEMKAIFDAIPNKDGGEKQFAVIRFDEKSKFIAFDKNNNSLTPYESSYIQLSEDEYLVWFEGLQYHNPNIQTQIALPMHIKFEYPKQISTDSQIGYLQEALNLSGANWRGFNAKTSPISFYYSRLVSKYVGFFDNLGYEDLNIENLPLWFL